MDDAVREMLSHWEDDAPWTAGELAQLALQYRAWGWTCLPVGNNKVPRVAWERYQRRRPRDREIGWMFARDRVAGLAVIPWSGRLAVRDFDQPAAYHEWARQYPDLAGLAPTVRTNRGFHVYVRLPPGCRPLYRKLADGEVIADEKHYVVLPPSVHLSGGHYRWLNEPYRRDAFPVVSPADAGFTCVYATAPEVGPGPRPSRAPDTLPARLQPRTSSTANPNTFCVTPPGVDSVDLPEAVERAVAAAVATGPGQRNGRLWQLTTDLYCLPEMRSASDDELAEVVADWHRRSLDAISTKSLEVSLADFRRMWEWIGSYQQNGIGPAVALALSLPLPPESFRYTDESVQWLVALCHALHLIQRGPFFLACRTAMAICGFGTYMTASRWLKRLVSDGLLSNVSPGRMTRAADRWPATVYAWCGASSHLTESPVDPAAVIAAGGERR